jgi:transmembrane sensor
MDNDRIWNLMAKKLAGEASPAEIRELENQLRLNPDLHYSLEAFQDMWKKKTRPEPELADEAFRRHMERMHILGIDMGESEDKSQEDSFRISLRRRLFWKSMAFVMSSFFLFILGYYFFSSKTPVVPVQKPVWEVVTRNGTRTNLLLPDGTTVWLNAGSRLTYDSLYGNNLREVTLSGEAYFDVVKNPSKPFIIHTGKINIKVLGTVFNVKSYPGEKTIETSLIRGSIEVTFPSIPSKKIILSPNQKLVINKTDAIPNVTASQLVKSTAPSISIQHLSRIGSDSAIAETGWMRNRLYFNDMSFHDLLKCMERKYGVTFQLSDFSMDTIHFTGSFQNESVIQALEALRLTAEKSTTDFSYSMQGNQVHIFSKSSDDPSIQTK